MKKITLFLFALFSCWQINAQVANYAFSQSSGTYTPITGGTVLGTTTSDDQRFVDPAVLTGGTTTTGVGFPIGFNFTFNEIVFDRVAINNNGWISLGQSSLTPSVNIASTIAYEPLTSTDAITPTLLRSRIAGIGDDLQAQTGSELRIETIGSAPNRVFVVQWTNYREYGTTGQNLNFQIRLNEITNIIEVVYGTMVFTSNVETAQIGLGGSTNTDFNNRSTTTDWNATTTGVTNTSSAAYSTTVTPPASGLTFVWTPPLPCSGTPVAGTVSPATQSLLSGQASAALTVTGQTSGVSSLTYQWEESTNGTDWVNATGGTGATTLAYTPPTFSGTTMMYRLLITCTASAESSVSTVATVGPCGALTVPALEILDTFLPTCWQEADNGDLTAGPATFLSGAWVDDGFGNQGTDGAARILIDGASDNDWIITPLYAIPSTGFELKYDAAATQSGLTTNPTTPWEADDFVEVLVSTGFTNWTVLYTYNAANANIPLNTGTPNVINLDAYAGQNIRFAFRAVEGVDNGSASIDFSIDNIQIRETPPCVEPTLLTAINPTSSSIDLSWTPGATELDWEYVVQPQGTGVPTGSGNAIDTNMFTESGLEENTAYEVYVRSFCDVTEQSAWVGPINFRTLCGSIISFPYTEGFESNNPCWTNSLVSGTTNWFRNVSPTFNDIDSAHAGTGYMEKDYNTSSALLISPSFDLTALGVDGRVKVWLHRHASAHINDQYLVYVNTTNSLVGATQILDLYSRTSTSPTVSATGWYEYILNIPSTFNTSSNVYVIFNGITTAGFSSYDLGVDDFTLEAVPACPEPTGLSITSLTNSTVNITWAATTGNYEYVLDNDAALPAGSGIGLSGETFTNASLEASTTYYFHVRSDCGSTWSTISFTTPVPPPANDDCANAVVLTVNTDFSCSTVTAGTTVGATNSGIEPAVTVTGTPDNDVWYSFTASASAHRISLLNIVAVTGFSTDMGIAVFDATGTCSALTLVGSSDPETYNLSGLTPGNIYYVAVYGWGASSGAVANFNICIGTPPASPANDECNNAISIPSMPYTNTQDASGASGPIVTTCDGMNDGVWYSVIGNGADIIIDVTNVNFDLAIGVYTGSCGSFTCVDITDDSLTNETYTILASTLGTIYYINIGYFSGTTNNSEGTYTMSVSTTLSSDSFDNNNFLAYPNPVKDIFNLSYSSEISSVKVINLLGQEVLTRSVNATSTQIDMSQLSAGTYIVNATVGDTVKVIKIVKQ